MTEKRKDELLGRIFEQMRESIHSISFYERTLRSSIGLTEEEMYELGIAQELERRKKPLEIGGGTEREKVFAIINDCCESIERQYGGTADRIFVSLIAENVQCTEDAVKSILFECDVNTDGDVAYLNDAIRKERREIAERPNYVEFVSDIRKKYFATAQASQDAAEIERCKNTVMESVKKEYNEMRDMMTLNRTAEDVFYCAYEIFVKTELEEAVTDYGLKDADYIALEKEAGTILENLYTDFTGEGEASVNSNQDAADFIHGYCKRNYPEIVSGEQTEAMSL